MDSILRPKFCQSQLLESKLAATKELRDKKRQNKSDHFIYFTWEKKDQ